MLRFRLLLLVGPLLAAGCLYSARERTDEAVSKLVAQPFDTQPSPVQSAPAPQTGSSHEAKVDPGRSDQLVPVAYTDVQTTTLLQPLQPGADLQNFKERIKIPAAIPGTETVDITKKDGWPKTDPEKAKAAQALYPPLPELPADPKPEPGPDGQPYTLAALQQIAAANSPTLRQAAFDVQQARGNLIQAGAYPNPTVSLQVQPSNDGSTAGVWGGSFDQPIKTFGKLRLATAAAQKDFENAELALKRARSDLSTQVRNNYFAVLVSKETVRVNKALAEFTDEVYRLQEKLLEVGSAAPYEPATLRAQARSARLAYKVAIQTYIYNWRQLVAIIGLRQLPLSEVAGRIDAFIPYYEYDRVLAHALQNHSDVLTAKNGIDKARYNLKLAQVTPFPDVDVNVAFLKEYALAPEKYVHTVSVGLPIPLWDTNKGNIYAAEAALGRALEEPHRVEVNLTNTLGNAYTNYKTSLDTLEDYRKYILPDQVLTYRGVFARYYVSGTVGFVDMVTAQQALATNVATYLTSLGQVWSAVVSVADLLQTDDLFQLAEKHDLAPLPDLDSLPLLPCCHPAACAAQHVAPAQPAEIRRMEPVPDQAIMLPTPSPSADRTNKTSTPAATTPASTTPPLPNPPATFQPRQLPTLWSPPGSASPTSPSVN